MKTASKISAASWRNMAKIINNQWRHQWRMASASAALENQCQLAAKSAAGTKAKTKNGEIINENNQSA